MNGNQNATEEIEAVVRPTIISPGKEGIPLAANAVDLAQDEVVVPSFEKHKGFRPPPKAPRGHHDLPTRAFRPPPVPMGGAARHNDIKRAKPKTDAHKSKTKDKLASFSKHSLHIDCLELPTKQTREIMRQVSGLGMEDPVFGLASNHSIYRRAAKNMPFKGLYDDMGYEDIPAEMRDMLSVCSDPTASVVGELPNLSIHRITEENDNDLLHLSKSSGLGAFERFHQSYDSVYFSHAAERFKKNPRRERNQFVPPKSISEFQAPQKQPIREIPVDFSFNNHNNSSTTFYNDNNYGKEAEQEKRAFAVEDSPRQNMERPSDRRWRNSTLAIPNNITDNRNTTTDKNPTNWATDNNAVRNFRSYDDFHWNCDKDDKAEDKAEGEDEELQLEDLFVTMKKMKDQSQSKHVHGKYRKPSKLSASDSNLRYFGYNDATRVKATNNEQQVRVQKYKELDKKMTSGGRIEGLELDVRRQEFSRAVSGLTLDAALVSECSVLEIPDDTDVAPTADPSRGPANPYHELMAVLQLEKAEDEEELEPKYDIHRRLEPPQKEAETKTRHKSDRARADKMTSNNDSMRLSDLKKKNDEVSLEESIDIVHPETKRLSMQNRKLANSISRFHRQGNESFPVTHVSRSSRQSRTIAIDEPISPKEKRATTRMQQSDSAGLSHSHQESRERRKSASARRSRTIAMDEGNTSNTKNEFIQRHYSHEKAKAEERKARVHPARGHSMEGNFSTNEGEGVDVVLKDDEKEGVVGGNSENSEQPSRKIPPKSFSHDTATRMLGSDANASPRKSLDRAQEVKAKFHQHKKQTAQKGTKKARSTGKKTSKRSSDFHASMGALALDVEDDLGMREAGNKSCGDLDFIGEI